MRIEQFHVPSLGHASYLVASDQTGEALVVDPQRDVRPYLDAAERHGLRIRWVADTHGHNDYLSGLRELSERTGATALGSSYATLGYPHEAVKDGQQLTFGDVGVEVMHTPGHTPEHLSFLVYDGEQDPDEPALLLSGGALLVGDLARPDLLGGSEATVASAQAFCRTLQEKVLALPDHVLVYPTHVAGSLCGGNIGARLSTTVGYERRTNPILRDVSDKDGFVRECLRLDDLPAVPPYWPRMRQRNLDGVTPVGIVDAPPALSPEELEAAVTAGATVLDARSAEAFTGGHIPGALQVGFGASFPTWAGTVLPEGATVVLVVDDPSHVRELTWELLRIGYDVPIGWLSGGMPAWRTSARPMDVLEAVPPSDVDLAHAHVVDVRQPDEWRAGHIPGAQFITGGELPRRLDELPRDAAIHVVCGSGYRSTVACAMLRREGFDNITNIVGGMAAWNNAGRETTTD